MSYNLFTDGILVLITMCFQMLTNIHFICEHSIPFFRKKIKKNTCIKLINMLLLNSRKGSDRSMKNKINTHCNNLLEKFELTSMINGGAFRLLTSTSIYSKKFKEIKLRENSM